MCKAYDGVDRNSAGLLAGNNKKKSEHGNSWRLTMKKKQQNPRWPTHRFRRWRRRRKANMAIMPETHDGLMRNNSALTANEGGQSPELDGYTDLNGKFVYCPMCECGYPKDICSCSLKEMKSDSKTILNLQN